MGLFGASGVLRCLVYGRKGTMETKMQHGIDDEDAEWGGAITTRVRKSDPLRLQGETYQPPEAPDDLDVAK